MYIPERYPLITRKAYSENGRNNKVYVFSISNPETRQVRVRKVFENRKKIYREIANRLSLGQQILIILNFVDRAVEIYQELKLLFPNNRIGLIHGRFIPLIRSKLEEEWLDRLGNGKGSDRSQGSILIGTQLLEQSLDIDGDFLLTDLAPSDLMFHRLGRVFRHKRPERLFEAEAWIICPRFPNINSRDELRAALGLHAKLYYDYILWRSYRLWMRRGIVTIPTDQREIIEGTYRYSISQDPEWIKEAFKAMVNSNFEKEQKALAATGSLGWDEDKENGDDMDDEPDSTDSIPIDVIEQEDEENQKAATRLQSVPTRQLLLAESVEEWNDEFVIKFLDGGEIAVNKNSREISNKEKVKIITEVTLRMAKVPISKSLADEESPEWLKQVVYGRPIPITIGKNDNSVYLSNGTRTEYFYTKECGFYKPLKKQT